MNAAGERYIHKVTNLSGQADHAHIVFPHVHRVASLLKRWILGTHQGAVEHHHLDAYLDEFVFRFNRRHSRNRGLLFWRLLCAVLEHPPVTRAELAGRKAAMAAADEQHRLDVAAISRQKKVDYNRNRYRTKIEATGRKVRRYKDRGKRAPRA